MSALPMSERRTDASDSSSSRGGEMWPTPAAMMPNDSEDPQEWLARAALLKEKHHNGNGAGTPLAVAVKLSEGSAKPTPRSCSAVWATITPEAQEKAGERFPNIESIVAITEGTAAVGAALSPAWVERLMGFPDDWTSPPTDGPSAPTKRNPKTSPRASRAKSR